MFGLHVLDVSFYRGMEDINLEKIGIIPVEQRRKLSNLAKLCISITLEMLEDNRVDYIVWVSRFGEENKAVGIMASIVEDYSPSPLQFSSSVHNAVGGLYSILVKDNTPYTSLGLTEDIIVNALFEAQVNIQSGLTERVLLVIYDEPLPKLYGFDILSKPFAFACLLIDKKPNLMINQIENSQSIFQNSFQEITDFYEFYSSTSATDLLLGCYQIVKC